MSRTTKFGAANRCQQPTPYAIEESKTLTIMSGTSTIVPLAEFAAITLNFTCDQDFEAHRHDASSPVIVPVLVANDPCPSPSRCNALTKRFGSG